MARFRNGFASPAILVIAVATIIATSGTSALSNESNCRRLEVLASEYAGVRLTSQQQQLKRRLLAWYNSNCKQTRSADARRDG
jgi:hypothetical protein